LGNGRELKIKPVGLTTTGGLRGRVEHTSARKKKPKKNTKERRREAGREGGTLIFWRPRDGMELQKGQLVEKRLVGRQDDPLTPTNAVGAQNSERCAQKGADLTRKRLQNKKEKGRSEI